FAVLRLPTTQREPDVRHLGSVPSAGTLCLHVSRLVSNGDRMAQRARRQWWHTQYHQMEKAHDNGVGYSENTDEESRAMPFSTATEFRAHRIFNIGHEVHIPGVLTPRSVVMVSLTEIDGNGTPFLGVQQ